MGRDLAADSDHNLWQTWVHIGRHARDGHVEEDDDVIIVETGSTLPTFNPVFVRGVPGTTVADATVLVRRAIDRELPVVLTVSPFVRDVERLVAGAVATGMVARGPLPGMVLANVKRPWWRRRNGTAAPGLAIRTVEAESDWPAYFDVLCRGFDVPLEMVAPIANPAIYKAPNIAAFLATSDDEPVATSLAFITGDVVGVYNVATVPSHRGQGFGAAMTRAAIDWGRDRDCKVAVLQASEMGRRVYERMGFVETVPYLQLVVPA